MKLIKTIIKIWYAALYIRLSRDEGNDISKSVINQTAILREFVAQCDDNIQIVDIYIDDGFTGTDSERDSFQRMLNDIREGKVNCVIVKDLSRLSRNYAEAGTYIESVFPAFDIRFISLELPFIDSYKNPDTVNNIVVPITNVMNDEHCRQTSIKIRSIFDNKRRNGQFIGAFAPYGYKKDPSNKSKLIIDDEAAEVVRHIFTWYTVEGLSKNAIVRRLNDLGISNPTTYKLQKGLSYANPHMKYDSPLWRERTVGFMLENEMYIGSMVQGRNRIKSYKIHKQIQTPKEEWFVVPNVHEAIVEESTFLKAQDLLRRSTRVSVAQKDVHLFAGLLHCADCRKAMHRKKTGRYVYYACQTYMTQSKTVCGRHTIREDELQEAVLRTIQGEIRKIKSVSDIIETIKASPVRKDKLKSLTAMMVKSEKEKEKLQSIKDSLYADWKNGDITKDDYHRLKEKYDTDLNRIDEQVRMIQKELDELKAIDSSFAPYFRQFMEYENITSLNRGLLLVLIDDIRIYEGKRIDIHFKFQNQAQLLSDCLNQADKNLLVN